MLTAYTFNTAYQPQPTTSEAYPSLRLLEGGKFSPEQYSPVLIQEYDQVRLKFFKWGLVPSWAGQKRNTEVRYTAPTDQLFQHSAFQIPVGKYRCLIPADGFYMEESTPFAKRSHKVRANQEETFCFAGIYDMHRQADGSICHTFAIITTPAADSWQQLGQMTPLILKKHEEKVWLNPAVNMKKLLTILSPSQPTALQANPVEELIAA
ncbi:MAG: SOS response-associated peptidase family protein [Bacteroidota bacterium]